MSVSRDYKYILKAHSDAGCKPEIFKDFNIAHIVVHKNKVYGMQKVKGLIIKSS
ncbi:MAG: hypothetical protein ACUVUG_03210 [Candidatus Aminicenantia bacterium]